MAVVKTLDLVIRAKEQVSKALGPAGRAIEAFNREVGKTQNVAGQARGALTSLLGAYLGFEGIRRAITEGLRYNAMMESSRGGLAALIMQTNDYKDALGNSVSPMRAYTAALSQADVVMKALQKANLDTAATLPELLTMFQQVQAVAGRLPGATAQNLVELTKRFSLAGSVMQIPQFQLQEEIRSVLEGVMESSNTLLMPFFLGLGIDNKVLRQWREQGTLIENVLKALESMGSVAQAQQGTWRVLFSNFKDQAQRALGEGFEPLFEYIKKNIPQIQAQLPALGDRLAGVSNGVISLSQFLEDHVGAIKLVAEAWLTWKILVVVTGYVKGLQVALIALGLGGGPAGWIVLGLAAIAAAVALVVTHWDRLVQGVQRFLGLRPAMEEALGPAHMPIPGRVERPVLLSEIPKAGGLRPGETLKLKPPAGLVITPKPPIRTETEAEKKAHETARDAAQRAAQEREQSLQRAADLHRQLLELQGDTIGVLQAEMEEQRKSARTALERAAVIALYEAKIRQEIRKTVDEFAQANRQMVEDSNRAFAEAFSSEADRREALYLQQLRDNRQLTTALEFIQEEIAGIQAAAEAGMIPALEAMEKIQELSRQARELSAEISGSTVQTQAEAARESVDIWGAAQRAIADGFMDIMDGAESFGSALLSFFRSLTRQITRLFIDDMAKKIFGQIKGVMDKLKTSSGGSPGQGLSLQGLAGGLSGIWQRIKDWWGGTPQGPAVPGAPLPGGQQGPSVPTGVPMGQGGGLGGWGMGLAAVGSLAGQMIGGRAGSIISGASSGAMLGFMLGGPVGAAIGVAGGGLLGGIFGGGERKKDPVRAAIKQWVEQEWRPAWRELEQLGFGRGIFEKARSSADIKALGWGKGIPQQALEIMRDAGEALKSSIQNALKEAFSASTAESGFERFLRALKAGISDYVQEGLIDAFTRSAGVARILAPIFEQVSQALVGIVQGKPFDVRAFHATISGQLGALTPALAAAKEVFSAFFDVFKGLDRQLTGGGGTLFQAMPPSIQGLIGEPPRMHTGGTVRKSGWINMEIGERVFPKGPIRPNFGVPGIRMPEEFLARIEQISAGAPPRDMAPEGKTINLHNHIAIDARIEDRYDVNRIGTDIVWSLERELARARI